MVGKANGMSMMTSSTRLPQKRSRTRTQAMRVPITMLITVASSDVPTVRVSAARVCGFVKVWM